MTLDDIWKEINPTTSPNDSINPPALFAGYYALVNAYESLGPSDVDKDVYELAKELFGSDLDGRTSIFSRGQALLPAIGIAVALVSSIGYGFVAKNADLAAIPVAAQLGMILCYLCTVWFLVRSADLALTLQGSQQTNTLGPDDVVPPVATASDAYKRAITVARLRYVIENYKATNTRMDMLKAAQKNIRNAVITIAVGGMVPVVVWFVLVVHRVAPSLGNPY